MTTRLSTAGGGGLTPDTSSGYFPPSGFFVHQSPIHGTPWTPRAPPQPPPTTPSNPTPGGHQLVYAAAPLPQEQRYQKLPNDKAAVMAFLRESIDAPPGPRLRPRSAHPHTPSNGVTKVGSASPPFLHGARPHPSPPLRTGPRPPGPSPLPPTQPHRRNWRTPRRPLLRVTPCKCLIGLINSRHHLSSFASYIYSPCVFHSLVGKESEDKYTYLDSVENPIISECSR